MWDLSLKMEVVLACIGVQSSEVVPITYSCLIGVNADMGPNRNGKSYEQTGIKSTIVANILWGFIWRSNTFSNEFPPVQLIAE
jgi:hypothetical protein